jgi:DUF1365 family protein
VNASPQIVRGGVRHLRLRPARHGFEYRTFFLMLPLRAMREHPFDALPRNRAGLVSFHDRDHGDGRADCLAWIEERLAAEGVNDADGEIWLQAYPRVLGYAFKPVSFWYCHRRDGSLAAIVAEVNNTFGERHCYLLTGLHLQWGRELKADKVFHVSPFCAVSGDYRFRFVRAGNRVVARVELHDHDGPLLLTSVHGEMAPATRACVRAAFISQPMMTLAVIGRIHWQALRLWIKRVPFLNKPPAPAQFVTRSVAGLDSPSLVP